MDENEKRTADLIRELDSARAQLRAMREALERIADPERETAARRSVIHLGPFGPARVIREMQDEALAALAASKEET